VRGMTAMPANDVAFPTACSNQKNMNSIHRKRRMLAQGEGSLRKAAGSNSRRPGVQKVVSEISP
jgi:hypothetical protein